MESRKYIREFIEPRNDSSSSRLYDWIMLAAIVVGIFPLMFKEQSTLFMLCSIQKFDPVFLSVPSLDEKLWNGDLNEGWLVEPPHKWPNDPSFEDDVDAAVECFKEIKRKYYFENLDGQGLLRLQPEEIRKSMEIFISFDSQKKKIKERLVRSINKLFLPASDDKKQLHIWTTHRYDLSQEAAVAISSKSVDSSELDIKMPRPADWLQGMEYMPNHIILKPKNGEIPVLTLDADFLRTLAAVENGYPVGLLAPQYEQLYLKMKSTSFSKLWEMDMHLTINTGAECQFCSHISERW